MRIIHQTGARDYEEMCAAFAESGLDGEVTAFIANMPAAFAEADLVVCRSGAGAVSELAAAGRASILVPFPFAADDHQTRNAEAMQRGGAARLVRDAELTGERLFQTVSELPPPRPGWKKWRLRRVNSPNRAPPAAPRRF